MKKTTSPALQGLEMLNEEYKTHSRGHQIFTELFKKALEHYTETWEIASKENDKFIDKQLEQARIEMNRLEALKNTLWHMTKESVKKYEQEYTRLEELGIKL